MAQHEQYIWEYFKQKIGNEYGVAGLMGNLYAESGLLPNNLQNTYETSLGYTDESYTAAVDSGAYSESQFVNDSAGYGLAQWTYWSRKQNLYNYWKKGGYSSIGSIELACAFLWNELSKSYKGVLSVLQSASSVREASDKVLHDFEGPENQSEAVEIVRERYGQEYYDKYAGTVKNEDIIEGAVAWITAIANDDSHGYDQDDRWSPDYDCSSLVITAYETAGCPVKTNGASYTGNMVSVFEECGFENIPYTEGMGLAKGDVLWVEGHTGMYIGNGQVVEAYSNELGTATGGETGDQTGLEIRISELANTSDWTLVLRLPSSGIVIPDDPDDGGNTGTIPAHKMSLLMMLLATRR